MQDVLRTAEFEAAVASWQMPAVQSVPASAEPGEAPAGPAEAAPAAVSEQREASEVLDADDAGAASSQEWEDLAQRRAGALAREQAIALKETAPVRISTRSTTPTAEFGSAAPLGWSTGKRQAYVRNSRHEATRASRLLSAACGFPVSVTGMVVPVGADELTMKAQPEDVHVLNRMRLARWLRARPQVLSDEQVDMIFAAARRSTTWSSPR